jgi:hypothetical protein
MAGSMKASTSAVPSMAAVKRRTLSAPHPPDVLYHRFPQRRAAVEAVMRAVAAEADIKEGVAGAADLWRSFAVDQPSFIRSVRESLNK